MKKYTILILSSDYSVEGNKPIYTQSARHVGLGDDTTKIILRGINVPEEDIDNLFSKVNKDEPVMVELNSNFVMISWE